MTNCPNCGAILRSHICEYCGTMVEGPIVPVRIELDPYRGKTELLVASIDVPDFEHRMFSATIQNCVKQEAMKHLVKLLEPYLIIQEHYDYISLTHNYRVALKVVVPDV